MKSSKFIYLILLGTIVTDSLRIITSAGFLTSGNSTYYIAFLNYFVLILMIYVANKGRKNAIIPKKINILFLLWFVINIINLFRSFFVAQDYWDWRFLLLTSFSFSFIPLAFYYGFDSDNIKSAFKFVLKYLFPFGFIIIPLALITTSQLYPRLMIMVSFFLLFIPYMKARYRLVVITVAVVSILVAIGFRTNLIKIGFSIILLILWNFRNNIKISWLKVLHTILFVMPLVFLSLAIWGDYNIFQEISSNSSDYYVGGSTEEAKDLLGDSRTFLYVEVLAQLDYTNVWILGESSIGSYESTFGNQGGAIGGKRYGSEVGILNILLKYGLLGVISYFFLLYFVSYYAIFHSNNFLSKMIGLGIAFRWPLMFIEEYTQFDLNFLFFWMIIGLVSSELFRSLSDENISGYFEFD